MLGHGYLGGRTTYRKSTRSPRGEGSIRRRADGRWEARFTVGHNPGTGKQIQKSVYGQN
ncbi:MAG: hypothetical protein LBJ12_02940 [Oscillospiraceae bacterium]|jgi:hypothetical protein|nr:hypothetical protein [Oscillospiraceae bacterium]